MISSQHVSGSLIKHHSRAKYIRLPDGSLRLVQIQDLSLPVFRLPGYEVNSEELFNECEETPPAPGGSHPEYLLRNLRRAKINAFDKVLANPDLDTFATFTLSPDVLSDRSDWQGSYKLLRRWLEDRVKRRGLKYVITPERHHKSNGIHFHALMNSCALRLSTATSAKTGQALTHNGQPLFNVSDWRYGFTSAELIRDDITDRDKVAKYIFKYMGKQGVDGRIGGRYVLMGGKLNSPVYIYGDNPHEFMPERGGYFRTSEHDGIKYREWSYI